jgi:hypothetical protein
MERIFARDKKGQFEDRDRITFHERITFEIEVWGSLSLS